MHIFATCYQAITVQSNCYANFARIKGQCEAREVSFERAKCESHGTGRDRQWSHGKSWHPKRIRVGPESLVLRIILGES